MSDRVETSRESEIAWQAWSTQRHIQQGKYNTWDAFMAGFTASARLADSRPVVSEGAIRAAAEAMRANGVIQAHSNARLALTAALPHMGDGKGEAEHERVLQGVKDCWKVDMLENRLLRDGIEKLADELEQQHRDAFGESLADNFPSALVTDLRDLLNPPRLSPTGDE